MYKNDPRPMTAKFNSTCSKCKEVIKKGAPIYYWPSNRTAQHEKCGETEYRQFQASVQDENFMSGQVWGSQY